MDRIRNTAANEHIKKKWPALVKTTLMSRWLKGADSSQEQGGAEDKLQRAGAEQEQGPEDAVEQRAGEAKEQGDPDTEQWTL